MTMNMSLLHRAMDVVRARFADARPAAGLILGSGLARVAGIFRVKDEIDYAEIPGLGRATVAGHSGRLLLADYEALEVLVFQGRRHWYEGDGWEPVALPVYLLKAFGAGLLAVTNVAAGIRKDLRPGRLMIIDDHINAIQSHPLLGKHDPFWGPRFPDQSAVYDRELGAVIDAAAERDGKDIAHGVYLAVPGPVYETPAEIRAFRTLGADAVGMSTVPEASLASSAGLRVLGVSCIANMAAGLSPGLLSHEEVTREAAGAVPMLEWLLRVLLSGSAKRSGPGSA